MTAEQQEFVPDTVATAVEVDVRLSAAVSDEVAVDKVAVLVTDAVSVCDAVAAGVTEDVPNVVALSELDGEEENDAVIVRDLDDDAEFEADKDWDATGDRLAAAELVVIHVTEAVVVAESGAEGDADSNVVDVGRDVPVGVGVQLTLKTLSDLRM